MCIFRSVHKHRGHILILPKWYPHPADPQNGSFIRSYARAISERYPVTVIFPVPSEKSAPPETNKNGGLLEILVPYNQSKSSNPVFRKIANFSRYRRAMLIGKKEMLTRRSAPDLIHAQVLIRSAMFAEHWSRAWSIPWILTEHSSEFLRKKALGGFKKFNIKKLCSKAAVVVTVSEPVAKSLGELCGRNDIAVIPNLIEFSSQPVKSAENSTIHIAVVADLVDDIKNISGVLRALSVVSDKIPQWKLTIAGDGKDRQELEDLTSELGLCQHVYFKGALMPEEVQDFLPSIDFLITNSHTETFSMVTAEAIACGKPAIVTRCGGPEQWFKPHYGLLIEPDSDNELQGAILKMSSTYRDYPAEQNAEDLRKQFEADKVLDAYEKIYSKLLYK